MALTLRPTFEMTFDEIAPLGREITTCLKRLVDRFPEEVTLQSAYEDIESGRRQLWLIMDDDRVVMVQITEIAKNLITGKSFVRCVNTGGAGIADALPLLDEIEGWARSKGATHIEAVGRMAWTRILKPLGYELKSVVLVKEL